MTHDTTDTFEVKATQFILPHGKKVPVIFSVPYTLKAKVDQIIKEGFEFQVEELRTGHASFTITDPEIGDFAHVISKNDESFLPKVISKLEEINVSALVNARNFFMEDKEDDKE